MSENTIPEIPIPAIHYDSALKFVNDRRAEKSLPALDKLPPGIPNHIHMCPCASECGAPISVLGEFWRWDGSEENLILGKWNIDVPRGFIQLFDNCEEKYRYRTAFSPGTLVLPIRVES